MPMIVFYARLFGVFLDHLRHQNLDRVKPPQIYKERHVLHTHDLVHHPFQWCGWDRIFDLPSLDLQSNLVFLESLARCFGLLLAYSQLA